MEYLSRRVLELQESQTIAMAQLSRELRAQGKDVISLSLGEPDFDTPEHIRLAAKEAIDEGHSHYTPVPGYLDLRETIAMKFKRDNGLDFDPLQIVVSTGAKQSIVNVLLSLLNDGDEVILPAPYWVSYASMVEIAGGETVVLSSDVHSDFKISPEQLESAITPKTKAFLFSSPCNPTGSVYTADELQALADVFARHKHVVVISDEIYEYINFEGQHVSISRFEEIRDQIVVVNGLSKGFAMTGWRLGYMAGPMAIAKACAKLQGQFTSATCAITQRAAISALTGTMEPTRKMCEAFKARRELVYNSLKKIPGLIPNYPKGAFYIFPNVSAYFGKSFEGKPIKDSGDLAFYLLNEALVAVVAGSAFGQSDCIRISFAESIDKLELAMNRIATALLKLS